LIAYIALALCCIFVAYLLHLEHKQSLGISKATWIPTIWMLYATSKPLGYWFHRGGTLETGSPIDRTFITIILCLSIIVLLRRSHIWANAFRENPWLFVLVAFMFISISWSSWPAISFKRWLRELAVITAAFVILLEHNPRNALKSILTRVIYILIPFSLVLIRFFPSEGRVYHRWSGELMWVGVTAQKNHLGRLCVIAIIFIVWIFWQRRKRKEMPSSLHRIFAEVIILILSVYLLGGPKHTLSYSATSTVALVLGLLIFVGMVWARKTQFKNVHIILDLIFVLIFIYGTITPFIGKLSFWDVSSIVDRSATLTGRINIWATLVPLAMNKPLLGHGVGGFWTTDMRQLTSGNAHNGYLDVLLHYGIIGLGLVFLLILSCARKAMLILDEDEDWAILFFFFLFAFLIHNITESSVFTFTSSLFTLIIFFLASAAKHTPSLYEHWL
jgi:exopolysaccharide production protein ExoQ